MKKEVIAHKNPKDPISEIFRTLRTNIQFMSTNGKNKVILMTSTFAGEGKSWVSSNLAVTFAQTGQTVLIIDADMRKGRQYAIWGISPKPGLSNYLSGLNVYGRGEFSKKITDYIQRTEVDNLFVMTAGNIPPNPSELLISTKMAGLLEEARNAFDIIIIDGTPSQLVTDSLILARIVDTTVIVTAYGETKKEDLKKVINNIKNVGGKIAGVVLNKFPITNKQYKSSYYYGSVPTTTTSKRHNIDNGLSTFSTINVEEMADNPEIDVANRLKANIGNSGIEIENKNDISLEKSNEILNEINNYIDNEKKNLR